MERTSRFGTPRRVGSSSKTTVNIIEPTTGFSLAQPPTDLQPGQTPYSYNFLMREGGLELRPTLTSYVSNPKPLDFITGGETIVSSVNSHFPLVSGTTQMAYYSAGSWSKLSYISTGGKSTPPSGATTDYWDIIQTYNPTVDDMIAVMGNESYQTLMWWSAGSTVFSTIPGAPRAKYVADFDNFVLGFNIRDVGSVQSKYIQRVQWSDRGAPLTWSFGGTSLAGFEDLLDAKGSGTRIMRMDDRLILFFEDEIWQGVRATGNSSFAFSPYDRTVGCPYGWTVALTPLGLMFLGRDLMVYLLPKGGGPATPIGYPVRRQLQNLVNNPQKCFSIYNPITRQYQLYYPVQGGTGLPQECLYINLGENSWAPQTYRSPTGAFSLTRGFVSFNDTATSDITWGGMSGAWGSTLSTWGDFAAVLGQANEAIALGTSSGSMYYESNGTMDGPIPIVAQWRSQAIGGDSPRNLKVMQEVRCDYMGTIASVLTVSISRDLGATFDAPFTIALPVAPNEQNVVGYCYTPAQYPVFQVQYSSNAGRLFRFQTQSTVGGSSA